MILQKKTPGWEPRVIADHSGASPVASALGIRSGATPRGHRQPNTSLSRLTSKQDISTLLAIGHLYFALT
jgi:hypothetical protein